MDAFTPRSFCTAAMVPSSAREIVHVAPFELWNAGLSYTRMMGWSEQSTAYTSGFTSGLLNLTLMVALLDALMGFGLPF